MISLADLYPIQNYCNYTDYNYSLHDKNRHLELRFNTLLSSIKRFVNGLRRSDNSFSDKII